MGERVLNSRERKALNDVLARDGFGGVQKSELTGVGVKMLERLTTWGLLDVSENEHGDRFYSISPKGYVVMFGHTLDEMRDAPKGKQFLPLKVWSFEDQ